MDKLVAHAVSSVLRLVDAIGPRRDMRKLNEALLDLEVIVEKMRRLIEQ